MFVYFHFGTEYQNARSFEIVLEIHLILCYFSDVIIYLFILLTLLVYYAFVSNLCHRGFAFRSL